LTEHYAELLAESGRHTEAIAAWEEVLKVEPNNALAQEALSKLRSGTP
jgi:cytochrome c-type biogenesis protein CcmH/NrfG